MNIKYTNDGRKVRVVGNLNNKEIIVQEIFVDKTGAEIPSGENFVVKSLHDAPMISWQEKDSKLKEQKYKKDKDFYEQKTQDLKRQVKKTAALIKSSVGMERFFSIEKLKTLDLFLAGAFTHFLITQWNDLEIVEFGKETEHYDTGNIKLLTLFGRSDGDLNWRLCEYSDGSGSSYNAEPCLSYNDALEKAQAKIDVIVKEKGASDSLIRFSVKHRLHISKKAISECVAKQIDQQKILIKDNQEKLKEEKLILKKLIKSGWVDQRKTR
jgi:hypothetical protein